MRAALADDEEEESAGTTETDASDRDATFGAGLGLFGVNSGDGGDCPRAIFPGYCRRRCQSFASRKVSMHARRVGNPSRAGIGTCGGLNVFAEDATGGGGLVEYYNATTDALAGAIDSRQPGCNRYGTIPACKPTIAWGPPRRLAARWTRLAQVTPAEMIFSQRSAFDATPNELSRALAEKKSRGERVIDLIESNPTRAEIPYDEKTILEALGNVSSLRYEPEPFGLPRARDAIAKLASVDASRVVLAASTSEAYGFFFKLFCDSGDEVLAPSPSYPLFSQLAAIEGVKLVPYRLRYDGAWHVDVASARAAMTSRTRALLVVSPNNPTGSCITKDELASLASFGLPIACDEVFAEYIFNVRENAVKCAAIEAGDALVFSLGGLSKLAALPQMKLAWMIAGGPDALVRPALERLAWIADAYLSLATPVQHALPALLVAGNISRDAITKRLRRNLDAIDRATNGTSTTRLDVEGGWYATLRVPRTRSEMETCLAALDLGVYVHPGAFFDFEDEAYVVVSLLAREEDIEEGVAKILEVTRER